MVKRVLLLLWPSVHGQHDDTLLLQTHVRHAGPLERILKAPTPMDAVGLLESFTEEVLRGEVHIDDAAKEALQAMLDTLENSKNFINDAHSAAVELRNTEAASVASCKNEFTTAKAEDAAIGTQVESTHSSHQVCRDAYKALKQDETTKCDAMNAFIEGLQPPSCAKPDRSGMDGYFKNWASHVASNQNTWDNLEQACSDAEKKARDKDTECDNLQASFETRFCQFRLDVYTTCSQYKGCYAKEKEDFELAIASTGYAGDSRKIEWSAIEKIKCFVNVLIADDDANEDRKSEFDKCQDAVPDTSHLDLDDVSIPDEESCPLSEVLQYPCTEAFTSSRYAGMWSLAECNSCDALPSHINVETGHICAPVTDSADGWSNTKHGTKDGKTYMGAYCNGQTTVTKTFNLVGGVSYTWSVVFDTWASVDNEAITLKANDQSFNVGSRPCCSCDNGWTEYPDNGATGQSLGSGGSGKHSWKDCYKAVENTFTAPSNGIVNIEMSMNINQDISDEGWGFHDMKFEPLDCPEPQKPGPVADDWNLVFQTGSGLWTPTTNAVGTVGVGTDFAKLSDHDINILFADDSSPNHDHYMFTSDPTHPNDDPIPRIIFRVPHGSWNDVDKNMGWFKGAEFCHPRSAQTISECTGWSGSCGNRFDTECSGGEYKNDCGRWFTDYSSGSWPLCFGDKQDGKRCFSNGHCSTGTVATRTNVKMYKWR